VLHILSTQNTRAVLNPACGTGEVKLSPSLMASLIADARPSPTPVADVSEVAVVDPADYPTDFVQPVFEFMREHREFRAAWIFGNPDREHENAHGYVLAVLMEPRDETLIADLGIVIRGALTPELEVEVSILDPVEPATAELVRMVRPFHCAPDFEG
jgi:hypothetical protein